MEKVLWLIKYVKSSLQSFVLEISNWMMLHGWEWPVEVDSDEMETLIENNQYSTQGR